MTADPENARLRTLLRRLHSMLAARDPVVFSQELGFIEAELQGQNGAVGFTAETSAPLLGMDTPWPLHETVAKLIQATEHLLGHHQCDVHGHEEFRTAANRAKEYLAALRSPETPVHSTRAGAPLLAAEINALPQRVRDYIHHLETDADPAGDKWRLAAAEENLAALTTLDSETPAHRKWPGEPPHCPSCSCGAPAAALRRYIVEQLGFLSDDDNCPAERFIRLAVAKLRAPETSGELERLRADNERLMHHVRQSPELSNEYVQLAEARITLLQGLLGEWFQRHGHARGSDGRLIHPSLDVDTASALRGAVKASAPTTCDTKCFGWPRCECGRRMP
jgi:hypothetical protein